MFLRKVSLFLFLLLLGVSLLSFSPVPAFASSEGSGHGGSAEKSEGGHGGGEGEAKKDESLADLITGGDNGMPVFIHMKPMVMPIITRDGAQQLVNLIVDMEMKDYDGAIVLSENMPKLRDTVLVALYGGLSEGSLRHSGALDLPKIKDKIKDAVNKRYGEDRVVAVYIKALAQRRF